MQRETFLLLSSEVTNVLSFPSAFAFRCIVINDICKDIYHVNDFLIIIINSLNNVVEKIEFQTQFNAILTTSQQRSHVVFGGQHCFFTLV